MNPKEISQHLESLTNGLEGLTKIVECNMESILKTLSPEDAKKLRNNFGNISKQMEDMNPAMKDLNKQVANMKNIFQS